VCLSVSVASGANSRRDRPAKVEEPWSGTSRLLRSVGWRCSYSVEDAGCGIGWWVRWAGERIRERIRYQSKFRRSSNSAPGQIDRGRCQRRTASRTCVGGMRTRVVCVLPRVTQRTRHEIVGKAVVRVQGLEKKGAWVRCKLSVDRGARCNNR
jgi:hypothetical protein